MNLNVALGIGVACLVAFYLVKALSRPISDLGRLLLRSAVAFCLIWAVDVAGSLFGFHLGLNLASALTMGLLGIPGAALILAVKYFI
jgi:inhibitor of the pro-sigma K processing machinery